MLTSSALYPAALPSPHKRVSYVTARTPDGTLLADRIPIGDGSVSARLSSRVTRTATFTASDEWFPVTETDPLSPAQSIVTISSGIGYAGGAEEVFPVFTGRVHNANRNRDGEITFRADDLAAEVIAADFEQPVNSQPGSSTVAEIERLVTEGYPQAVFGTHDVDDAVVPPLSWDDDRGSALDDLSFAVEGRWYVLGDGSFVVRRLAYTALTPVVSLADGTGGLLTSATTTVSADGAYNSVVVIAERMDSEEPVRAVERNTNTASPYRYGGPFGVRVRKISAQTASGFADAQRIARSQLEAAGALSRQWQLESVADHRIEPGDVAAVSWRGVSDVQIIDSVTYPLGATGSMSLTGRSRIDPADVS